ncbi:PREDICTED: protein SRG1-like [Tarenaya hassleriana]|uniref:protein SRG1-like n=1 Tax=Tarenaya hassleriana TaxID=28532 RepID=UPI00053C29BF|nr:PREDICTED: protein SRG1-like [Tarenaya hassleriana]
MFMDIRLLTNDFCERSQESSFELFQIVAMEVEGKRQWSSLIVPSVQELVKDHENNADVPPRYVRWSDPDKADEIVDGFGPRPEIPIIDMNRLCSESAMDSEIQKLDFACREWGFFQLVNHGIDSCFLDKVKDEIQDFFDLPMEEKRKFWQKPSEIEGFGQAFVVSEDQKLDWSDMFFVTIQPPRSRKPHLFRKLPLPFRDTLETYSSGVKDIAKLLLAKMAHALKIKPDEMEDLFDDLMQGMRMNSSPPCPKPDQVTGITPHSDAVGLTVLLQVNEVEGLQIKKDGKWVPVKPLPNAFIVNIGDILEIITNGTYRSVEHRAMVNHAKERLSVATFHSPGMDTEIGPAKSLVDRHETAVFRSVTTEDYFKGLFSRELNGKSYLDVMRI